MVALFRGEVRTEVRMDLGHGRQRKSPSYLESPLCCILVSIAVDFWVYPRLMDNLNRLRVVT
jgi:hypothetical protein